MSRFKSMFFSAVLIVSAMVCGQENLLLNGRFNAEQSDFPDNWLAAPAASGSCRYERTGGPDGKPAVVLNADGGNLMVRQQKLLLIPGEEYRLSGWFKTRDLKAAKAGILIIGASWKTEAGISKLPENSDWHYVERKFKMIKSVSSFYGVVIGVLNGSGELQAADVKLEALTEAGRQVGQNLLKNLQVMNLVPLGLLDRIPAKNPSMEFEWAGVLEQTPENYDCEFSLGDRKWTVPLKAERFRVDLAGLKPGKYRLELVIKKRADGEKAFETGYNLTVVESPEVDLSQVRSLNNLVANLLETKIVKPEETLKFSNPRDGWVFFEIPSGMTLKISDLALTAEAFRYLPASEYTVRASGVGILKINAVPEIINYPPCRNSYVNENGNGNYDWDFIKKYVLRALTTHNGGELPGEALTESRARGLQWITNVGKRNLDDLYDRMAKAPGMTQEQYDGITVDELFFSRPEELVKMSKILRRFQDSERRVNTWIVGKPSLRGVDSEFMSAAFNTSRGRGMLWYEAYGHAQRNEKAAAAHMEELMPAMAREFNRFFPNAMAHTAVILGNFTQIPLISLDYYPEADIKYQLDMQMNILVNDPAFKGVPATGFWGSYYADEEIYRWSFRLLRHYAVEGNRRMLSPEYDFRYQPGHLVNCDFQDGLTGWTVEGQVTVGQKSGYSKNSQRRWYSNQGDTFCVLERGENSNRITQTAQKLIPGRWYSLQFVVGDYNDIMAERSNSRQFPLEAQLDGAEIDTAKSFVYADKRKTPAGKKEIARINLHRIVFQATGTELKITFSDRAAKPGEKLALNFVQLRPYFKE